MRRILIFFVLIPCYCVSQITLKPQWKAGNVMDLEYSFVQETTSDSVPELDTAHALIKCRYLGLYKGDPMFDVMFTQFYGNSINGRGESDKREIYPMLTRTMARCGIVFRLTKKNEVDILNEHMLDSVANIVMDEILAGRTDIKPEDRQDWKSSVYRYSMYRNIYKPIRDFFWVYQFPAQRPGMKEKISPKIMHDLSNSDSFADTIIGFSLLEDKDPKAYKWKLDANLDFTNGMKMMMDAGEKWRAMSSDSATQKISKPKVVKSGEIATAVISVSRPDMLVASCFVSNNHDLIIDGHSANIRHETRIKVK